MNNQDRLEELMCKVNAHSAYGLDRTPNRATRRKNKQPKLSFREWLEMVSPELYEQVDPRVLEQADVYFKTKGKLRSPRGNDYV